MQAAKGYPGRRKPKTNKAIEEAAASAERETQSDDPFAVPTIFRRSPAYYRRATELWVSLADTLRASGRRRPGYRAALTRYCIWVQMHEDAVESLRRDCPKGGTTYEFTPVGGTSRIVQHPSLKTMKDAEPILRQIEDDFGFSPRADSALVRVESFNRTQQGDLFGRTGGGAGAPRADAPDEAGVPEHDPLDLMTSTDSTPPTLN
ncbi:P27 family phage terminase small subunit [Aureimonas ureilytica]|uniref:P27 family phage terminase small subunit n=1 Tax=Aureimonas ureilytica TaxID=401562 RepID=UPI00073411C2|nr:P27 family phage terminase small subunit [Aureimonas ureilytica]